MSKDFSRWRPHPWHGLEVGPNAPETVSAYIEITPFDTVKYEIDKVTGYTCVDRPQRSTSLPPTPYGFIPRTWCGDRVRDLTPGATVGDGDPLDICIISERPINRADVLVQARVIGGLQMLDDGEADDKIIAVVCGDCVWGNARDLSDIPEVFVERLRHYFETYKLVPGKPPKVKIDAGYGREHAEKVVRAAMADYDEKYGSLGD